MQTGWLLLLMILIPIVGALIVYPITAKWGRIGGYISVGLGALSAICGICGLTVVTSGQMWELPLSIFGYGRGLAADGFSLGLGIAAAVAWTIAMLFSVDYMGEGFRLPRYWAAMLVTMGSTIGVFMARDLITLFVFFEVMTFASYLLVIHEEKKSAIATGRTFLYLGCIGGLALCFAAMILGSFGELGVHTSVLTAAQNSGYFPLLAVLGLIGFGMKAGMIPLHIWLPRAHPVAPAPASAVLSGVLIKAGAYGLVRMFVIVLGPGMRELTEPVMMGTILLVIGLATMVVGGFSAMFQVNAKRILAYSSVSQMGYILTGVGSAVIVGSYGGVAFAGAFFHMLNHVVFKAAAFMAIGYVYMMSHDLDIRNMSGLWKKMPWATIAFVAAFGAIAGLPGFSGFMSKTMIHHGIVDAYYELQLPWLKYGEKVFKIASSFTVVYFIRLAGIFFGKKREPHLETKPFPLANAALITLTCLILIVGLAPDVIISGIVIPAAKMLPYSEYAISHVEHVELFATKDITGVFTSFGIGIALYLFGAITGLFWVQTPRWSRVCLEDFVSWGMSVMERVSESVPAINRAMPWSRWSVATMFERLGLIGSSMDKAIGELYCFISELGHRLTRFAFSLDRRIDNVYERGAASAKRAVFSMDEEPVDGMAPAASFWSPWNLNTALIITAVSMAGLLLFLFVR